MRSAFSGLFVCVASALAAEDAEPLVSAEAKFSAARVDKGVVLLPLEIGWQGERAILMHSPDSGLINSDTTGYMAPKDGAEPGEHEFLAQHRERSDIRTAKYRVIYLSHKRGFKELGITRAEQFFGRT